MERRVAYRKARWPIKIIPVHPIHTFVHLAVCIVVMGGTWFWVRNALGALMASWRRIEVRSASQYVSLDVTRHHLHPKLPRHMIILIVVFGCAVGASHKQ